ncbi:MAG: hypothetical protein ACRD63_13445, partial [Pyrinomonadaceae bacterium]
MNPKSRKDCRAVAVALIIVLLMTAGLSRTLKAQSNKAESNFDIKANYEKHEYQIPMRDGVKLFTSVYIPRQKSGGPVIKYPIMLSRTPYSVGP